MLCRRLFLAALVASSSACAHSDDYLIVTVDARPAVHDARSISVTLANAGTTRTDSLELRAPSFPVTFSISAPGRTGELTVTVDALDDNGLSVGHGVSATPVNSDRTEVMLDSTDFVVNTDYAGNQFPSDNVEAAGFQVTARPDGTWTTVFRDDCVLNAQYSCNVFARELDQTGAAVRTDAAAGTNAFVVTTSPTDRSSIPAVASSPSATVVLWAALDATTSSLACRSIDGAGRLGSSQIAIENLASHVISVTALPTGNFMATWRILNGSVIDEIHMATLSPDCALIGAVQVVAHGNVVADLLHRGSVASSADRALITWVTNGDVHVRMASTAGAFTADDSLLVPQTATDEIKCARVVPAPGGGFVVGARWAQKAGMTGPGKIELYRVDASGAVVGSPTLVSDRTGSAFDDSQSFAMASRPDGTLLVAWHACGMLGDDSLCGVFGRILRDTGAPVTDAFLIPTSTSGDQRLPSVAALPDAFVAVWSDSSMKPPDPAMKSTRARILYPPASHVP